MQTVVMLAASGVASLGGVAAAGLVLALPDSWRRSVVSDLVSFAVGALLGAAFFAIIPEAIELAPASAVHVAVLAGIVLFFVLEKVLLWRHCHDAACERHGAAGALIALGDGLHNFVDGVLIAGAFLVSTPLGVSTALATLAHEVPQEASDFAIMLDSGYSRRKALILNVSSALATIAGTLVGYWWLDAARKFVPFVLASSAGSFIYIAVADLMPGLHRESRAPASIRQVGLVVAGVLTMYLLAGHDH